MYGFLKAFIACPDSMKRPFLPYKHPNIITLSFPTGGFLGFYYTEEFLYAQSVGYTVQPLGGYLYEKGACLFDKFFTELYGKIKGSRPRKKGMWGYLIFLLENSHEQSIR